MKKGILLFVSMLLMIGSSSYGLIKSVTLNSGSDLVITPVTSIPAVVVQPSVVSNIVYNLHNASASNTYTITFQNLSTQGITYTSTCSSLAPSADCKINMTFDSSKVPLGSYIHPFWANGATPPGYFVLNSKIVAPSGDINADANITLSDGGTTSDTFTVTLTPSSGSPYVFNTVPFGKSELSPAIPQGTYTTHITPASMTVGGNTYDAPLDGQFHLAQAGDTANFVYTKDQNISVTTNITAPNIGLNTVDVTAKGPTTYGPKAQGSGSENFDNMYPGQYTVTATNYTGTDSEVYTPTFSNPYTIDPTHTVIAITYTAQPPSTEHVSTNITAPNLPSGSTVGIKLTDLGHTYGPHNQPAGTAPFDTVLDNTDYDLTCDDYTVGGVTYRCTPSNPYTIDPTHTVLNIVYSKVAPPGSDYNWHASHIPNLVLGNFAAIYWGGGSTTSVVQLSSNPPPNLYLASTITDYENSPATVKPTAVIKHFPSYLAMGTVSEVTQDVTNQLAQLKMDGGNHYMGNGDANAGCYAEQQNANGASGGSQSDYFYRAAVPGGTSFFYWEPGNDVIPAGTYVVTGDQFVPTGSTQQYTGEILGVDFDDPTHAIIREGFVATPSNSNPDLANTKTVTFTAPTTVATVVTFPEGVVPPGATPTSTINIASNMCGSMYYSWGGFHAVNEVDDSTTQAKAIKLGSSHNFMSGEVLYTTRFSDGESEVLDDISNPYSVSTAFYNLMLVAHEMQSQYTAQNIPQVLFLNPDSTGLFQGCGQYYCPLEWKPKITNDANTILLANNQMQQSIFTALDRMQSKGYLTPTQVTNLKTDFTTNGILTPRDGRTVPGIPEYMLAVNWVMHNLGPDVAFGNGNNVYDSSNPLVTPTYPGGAAPSYATASIDWVHAVNHSGLTPTDVNSAILLQSQRYAQFLKDMNFVGNPAGQYKPDFIYFDKYERDEFVNYVGTADNLNYPDPTYITGGYGFNGVDWDSYLLYMNYISENSGINVPLVLWQMPGSQFYKNITAPPSTHMGMPPIPNITNLSSTGLGAIVQTKTETGLHVGDSFTIQYAAQTPYNGSFTVESILSSTEFTYHIPQPTTSPATPVPGYQIEIGGIPGTRYLASSTPDWVFGDPALDNDFTNINGNLGFPKFLWTDYMNTSVYYTKNSNVTDAIDYLRLTSAAQLHTNLLNRIENFFRHL